MKEELARIRRIIITFAVIYLVTLLAVIGSIGWAALKLMHHFAVI